ncbi:MAG: hypothetical protein HQM13_11420 [SAR324 cluster bacterium]|nr:hypothetical protein [SAR324 cluster bacterium]
MLYDTKNWLKLCFRWKGSVLPNILTRLILITIIGILVKVIRDHGYDLIKLEIMGHTLIGIALGLLIVFRINTANDRWNEGRRAWGRLFTIGNDFMRMCAIYTDGGKEFSALCRGYVISLKHLLHKSDPASELRDILPEAVFNRVLPRKDVPYAIATEISFLASSLLKNKSIDEHQSVYIEQIVSELVSIRGTCIRIQKTPIPLSYSVHIHQMLYFYLFTLPFATVPLFGWLGVFIGTSIAFGLLGIHEAAVEIEDPFGYDMNDLPLDSYCDGILLYLNDTEKFVHELKSNDVILAEK